MERLTYVKAYAADVINGTARERRRGYITIDGKVIDFEIVAHKDGGILHLTLPIDGPAIMVYRQGDDGTEHTTKA